MLGRLSTNSKLFSSIEYGECLERCLDSSFSIGKRSMEKENSDFIRCYSNHCQRKIRWLKSRPIRSKFHRTFSIWKRAQWNLLECSRPSLASEVQANLHAFDRKKTVKFVERHLFVCLQCKTLRSALYVYASVCSSVCVCVCARAFRNVGYKGEAGNVRWRQRGTTRIFCQHRDAKKTCAT